MLKSHLHNMSNCTDLQSELGDVPILQLQRIDVSDFATPRAGFTVRIGVHVHDPVIIAIPQVRIFAEQLAHLVLVHSVIARRIRTSDADRSDVEELRFYILHEARIADSLVAARPLVQLHLLQTYLT